MLNIESAVTLSGASQASEDRSVLPSSRAEWIALIATILGLMALRAPFLNTWQPIGDSANYALGALRTHVAHPPGSIGYCLLADWLDVIVGQVFAAMLIMSLVGATLGTFFCYLLGKAIGLRWPAALLTAGVYSASVNTLTASILCLPHVLEGMFAALFGTLAVIAIRRGSSVIALVAGIVLAIAGAIRPTTTMFLLPAWLYMLWQVRPVRWVTLLSHICLFCGIIAMWQIANDHYMAAAGYGGTTFDLQAMMPSAYEYASFSIAPPRFESVHSTYHMPWWEIASWLDRHTGLYLLPHKANWPEPSLKRAATLLLMQTCKFSYFLVVSAPVFVIAGLAWLFGTLGARASRIPNAKITGFLTIAIGGPVLLFMFGHMGAPHYLQIFLPFTAVCAIYLLLGPDSITSGSSNSRFHRSVLWRRTSIGVALMSGLLGAVYFCAGRPLPSTSKFNRTINIVLVPFTGDSIKYGEKNANRITGSEPPTNPFDSVHDDAGFLRVADEICFSPVPDVLRKDGRRTLQLTSIEMADQRP